jgi:hypothetical protein
VSIPQYRSRISSRSLAFHTSQHVEPDAVGAGHEPAERAIQPHVEAGQHGYLVAQAWPTRSHFRSRPCGGDSCDLIGAGRPSGSDTRSDVHPAGEWHWDGAKDEEVVLQVVGYGPSSTELLVKDAPMFLQIGP